MKKIPALLLFMVSIITILSIESCQTAKSVSGTKMLKFNFEKGKGYDYEMIINMDQEIMGQKMQMDMSNYYSMDVVEDDGNIKTITSKFDRFKMKMNVVGMNLEVDTDNPLPESGEISDGKTDPFKKINQMFGAIKGQQFSMKVDQEGKILSVEGFENMGKMLADSLDLNEKDQEDMMKQFNEQFNAKSTKSQFERFLYIFPNKEVKVGDSWQKNSEISGPVGGKYASTYKVTEIEGDMVTLEETTKMESEDEKVNLKGDIKGTLVIDSKSGLVVSADQDMKMVADGGGMKFEINGKTKIKGKARN